MARVVGRWIISLELVVTALLLAGLFVWVSRSVGRPDPRIAELEARVAAADSALAVAQAQVVTQAVTVQSMIAQRQAAQEQARKASGQLQGLIAANRNLLAVSTVDSNHTSILRERLAATTAAADVLVATVDTLQARIAVTDSALAVLERMRVSERIQAQTAIAARDSVITELTKGCQLGPIKCPSRVSSYLFGVLTLLVIL